LSIKRRPKSTNVRDGIVMNEMNITNSCSLLTTWAPKNVARHVWSCTKYRVAPIYCSQCRYWKNATQKHTDGYENTLYCILVVAKSNIKFQCEFACSMMTNMDALWSAVCSRLVYCALVFTDY